jgi:[acyl-carrier-protein] S-malonyltransferase
MGQDLYDARSEARAIIDAAEKAAGLPIRELCFQGPMEKLTETINLQPAVTAINLACLELIRVAGIDPTICAGHSLGEYSALAAAGVVSTEDCIRLVLKRGQLMHREACKHQGAMSAIVGLSIEEVYEMVAETIGKGIVAVANHNSADQVVITGDPAAVQTASDRVTSHGGRAIALKVSGAWHSPLIKGAEEEFRQFLKSIPFSVPNSLLIHNVTAETENDPDKIKAIMALQLCSPVRWYDTMQRMVSEQVEIFVEIGPGKVLTGLLKKGLSPAYSEAIYNVSDMKSLEKFLEAMKGKEDQR